MRKPVGLLSEQMTYDELYAAVRTTGSGTGEPFDFEIALRDYLTPQHLPKIEDAALTRVSSDFEGSHGGYPKTIVSLVRGEQERRSQIRQARNETIAAKSLRWSQWGTWIAAIAAVAAIIGAIASIAHH